MQLIDTSGDFVFRQQSWEVVFSAVKSLEEGGILSGGGGRFEEVALLNGINENIEKLCILSDSELV
jgi:hypothetical protein